MARLAAQCNVKTITAFFGQACARSLRDALPGTPSLIVANNVFNHANEPLDFLLGVKHLLAPEGTFVFELPYWLRLVERRRSDLSRTRHVFYRNRRGSFDSSECAADVEEVDHHGGSLRVYARHGERARRPRRRGRSSTRAAARCTIRKPRRFMAQALLGRDRFLETPPQDSPARRIVA
jgi:SAM-dependent methyltransferase